MKKIIIRLDDACERMDIKKWNRMETLLDKYGIKPLVGVIPFCEDPEMDKYRCDNSFWDTVEKWISKGWTIALHGYNHVYTTHDGGLNPVNLRSEFAGLSLELQKQKIKLGVSVFREHNIEPKVFFAPSHTFDLNTLLALKEESNIRIVSDTFANKPYSKNGIVFVPQQSGRVRKMPFNTVTFCYHPNTMTDEDFSLLRSFIEKNKNKFKEFDVDSFLLVKRKESLFDKLLKLLYFKIKKHGQKNNCVLF